MAEQITEHLTNLRDQLRLTSEQEVAWARFVNTIQETATRVVPASERQTSSRTLEQGIAAYETGLNAHLEAIRIIRDALSDLANALSDVQAHRLKMETPAFASDVQAHHLK